MCGILLLDMLLLLLVVVSRLRALVAIWGRLLLLAGLLLLLLLLRGQHAGLWRHSGRRQQLLVQCALGHCRWLLRLLHLLKLLLLLRGGGARQQLGLQGRWRLRQLLLRGGRPPALLPCRGLLAAVALEDLWRRGRAPCIRHWDYEQHTREQVVKTAMASGHGKTLQTFRNPAKWKWHIAALDM
jgi:hypothetical protein